MPTTFLYLIFEEEMFEAKSVFLASTSTGSLTPQSILGRIQEEGLKQNQKNLETIFCHLKSVLDPNTRSSYHKETGVVDF